MDVRPHAASHLASAGRLAVIAGAAALTVGAAAAGAAELKVVSPPPVTQALTALSPQIEHLTGTKVALDTATGGAYGRRLAAPFDVTIVGEEAAATLRRQGKVAAGGLKCIGWTRLGLAVRAGASAPQIGTVDGLRQTLLAARAIAFTGDEESGMQFRTVLVQLGIAEQVTRRLIDTGNGDPIEAVADGRAELAVALQSDIAVAHGVRAAGALPLEVQHYTPLFAVLSSDAAEAPAARRLITFLGSSRALTALHAVGVDGRVAE